MDGRKNNGGKREGAGRKSKAEEMGLAALLEDCWSEEDRRACISKLAKDCKSRVFQVRHESRKLLMAYAFGKPKDSLDLTSGGQPITELIKPKVNDGDS